VFGGLFIVPLYALDPVAQCREPSRAHHRLQQHPERRLHGDRRVARHPVAQRAAPHHPQLFILAAVLNAIVAIYIYTLVPEFLMRFLSWVFVNIMYRIKVRGLENIPRTGPRCIVCNHVSFMDALVHRRQRAPAGAFRHGPQHLQDTGDGLHLPHARAIPIAPAREDPAALARPSTRSTPSSPTANRLHLSRGQTHAHGEMNEFKRGVEKDPRDGARCPWCPWRCAACGAASSASRDGKPAMSQMPKRFWSRIELIATAPVHGDEASAEGLQRIVAGLRGEWQ
jgi:hypothetical protein